jgi:hypothetical protein
MPELAQMPTGSLENLEDDLDRYSPEEDHGEVAVVVEFETKRYAIIDVENETDRGMNLVIIHVGEWDGFVAT